MADEERKARYLELTRLVDAELNAKGITEDDVLRALEDFRKNVSVPRGKPVKSSTMRYQIAIGLAFVGVGLAVLCFTAWWGLHLGAQLEAGITSALVAEVERQDLWMRWGSMFVVMGAGLAWTGRK